MEKDSTIMVYRGSDLQNNFAYTLKTIKTFYYGKKKDWRRCWNCVAYT